MTYLSWPGAYPFGRDGEAEGGLLSGRTARRRVLRVTLLGDGRPGGRTSRADFLAGEEPLGVRVNGTALTMTMRTPGDDVELAAGFLVSEAVIGSPADIAEIKLCDGTACGHVGHDGMGAIADVTLAPGVAVAPGARRNFMTTSACGICGKTSIEDVCVLPPAALAADTTRFAPDMLAALRGRGPAQRGGQGGGMGAARRPPAPDRLRPARQRPRLVRAGPEGPPGGHPAAPRCSPPSPHRPRSPSTWPRRRA